MAQSDRRIVPDEWTRDLIACRTECGRSRSPGACQYGRNLNAEWDRIDKIEREKFQRYNIATEGAAP